MWNYLLHTCVLWPLSINILTVFRSKSSFLGLHIAAPALLKTISELKPSYDHWFEQAIILWNSVFLSIFIVILFFCEF